MERTKTRVLILSYRTPPDHGAASARAGMIAEALKMKGHRITMPRLWSPNLRYEGYLRRMLIYLGFMLSYSLWLLDSFVLTSTRFGDFGYDRVIYVSPWSLTFLSWPAALFGRFIGAEVVMDVHDAFPEVFPRKLWSVLRLASKLNMRLTNKVTLASSSMGSGSKKEEELPLAVDVDIFKPQLTVGFSGNLSKRYDFETLLLAAKLLPEIRFKMRGKGEMEDSIQKALGKNATLETETLTQGRLVEWLNSCDILVCPLIMTPETEKSSVPQKLLEYMAVGKPIISTSIGQVSYMIGQSGAGLLVPPGNPETLAEAILHLCEEPELRARLGSNGRKYVVKNHSIKAVLEKMEKIIG